jgi:hypothetical protein
VSGGFFERNLRVGGYPGFKFQHNAEEVARGQAPIVGNGIRGTIVEVSGEVQATNYADKKPAFDKNDQPIMQVICTIQTHLRNWESVTAIPTDENDQPKHPSLDDGKRSIFIKNQMARATAKALKEAGGQAQVVKGLVVGDDVAWKVSGYHNVGKGTPMVEFECKYWIAPQNSGSFAGHLDQPAQQAATPDPFAGQQQPAQQTSAPAAQQAPAAPAGGPPPSAPAPQGAPWEQTQTPGPWDAQQPAQQPQAPAQAPPAQQQPAAQPQQQRGPVEAPF